MPHPCGIVPPIFSAAIAKRNHYLVLQSVAGDRGKVFSTLGKLAGRDRVVVDVGGIFFRPPLELVLYVGIFITHKSVFSLDKWDRLCYI